MLLKIFMPRCRKAPNEARGALRISNARGFGPGCARPPHGGRIRTLQAGRTPVDFFHKLGVTLCGDQKNRRLDTWLI